MFSYSDSDSSFTPWAARGYEQSTLIRSYRSVSVDTSAPILQVIRKQRVQSYNRWIDGFDGPNADLAGGVRSECRFPVDPKDVREGAARWSDVVLFDGELVDLDTARRVLDILGHLDDPDFEAGRGLSLHQGFWRTLDKGSSTR